MANSLLNMPAARGVLSGLSPEQTERVLGLLSHLISATDIEHHGVHMAAFSTHWVDDDAPKPPKADVCDDAAARAALLALLLKAADVSNAAKPWPLAARWAGLLKAEHLLLGAILQVAGLLLSCLLRMHLPAAFSRSRARSGCGADCNTIPEAANSTAVQGTSPFSDMHLWPCCSITRCICWGGLYDRHKALRLARLACPHLLCRALLRVSLHQCFSNWVV